MIMTSVGLCQCKIYLTYCLMSCWNKVTLKLNTGRKNKVKEKYIYIVPQAFMPDPVIISEL